MFQPNVTRRDYLLVMDCQDGSLNNDPDTNAPRMDPDTGIGLVSAECLKRKIRTATQLLMGDTPGYGLFVAKGAVLNRAVREAYEEAGVKIPDAPKKPAKKGKVAVAEVEEPEEDEEVEEERNQRVTGPEAAQGNERLKKKYFDVRWFGQVVLGVGSGRLTGPVQFNVGRSVLPISINEVAHTRVATTNEAQSKKQKGLNQNFSRKAMVSHAVYTQTGHLSPHLALASGFTEKDADVLHKAMKIMFENDRASSRGLVTLRQVYIFEHTNPLGDARAADLFKLVSIKSKVDDPSSFDDYEMTVNRAKIPAGITIKTLYSEEMAEEVAAAE